MIYQLAVAQLIFKKTVIVFLVIGLLAITTRKNHIHTNIQRFYLTRLTSRADTSITTGIFVFGWWFHVQPSCGRNSTFGEIGAVGIDGISVISFLAHCVF